MADIDERVRAIVSSAAPDPAESLDRSSRLIEDLGFSSLDLMDLRVSIELEFDLEPMADTEDLDALDTVGALIDVVERSIASS